MRYTCDPTKDYYVDAYFLLKKIIEEISKDSKDAQVKAAEALKQLEKMR